MSLRNKTHTILLENNKELELIESEMLTICRYAVSNNIIRSKKTEKIYNRKYYKNEKIKKLFKKYYKKTKTKKETFEQISKELEISFKAVEKAYYKK